jgi:transposase
MEKYIGCDSHQRYSVFVTMNEKGEAGVPVRVEHTGGELRKFLRTLPPGAPVAVKAGGGWYWFVDALEEAGLEPHLANPLEAKKQMPGRKKTDKLDARGLATLLRVGTLPEVWIPPARLRDLRALMRTRLSMRRQGTFLKNRIHAAVRRYGLRQDAFADLFSGKARITLSGYIDSLPDDTRFATTQEWEMLNQLERHIDRLEVRIRERICRLGWVRLLKTLPGVGDILGATIHLEIGDVKRFPTPPHRAAYAEAGAERAFQRRQNSLRAHFCPGKPLFEMGVCGSGQCHRDASRQVQRAACRTTLSKAEGTQVPRQGSHRRRPASGGIELVDFEKQTSVSSSGCTPAAMSSSRNG